VTADAVCYLSCQVCCQPDGRAFPYCCCGGIGRAGFLDFPWKAGEGEIFGESFGPCESRPGIGANDRVGTGSICIDNGDAARETRIGDLGGDLGTGGLGTRRHIGRGGDEGGGGGGGDG